MNEQAVYALYDTTEHHHELLGIFTSREYAGNTARWYYDNRNLSSHMIKRVVLNTVNVSDLPVTMLGVDDSPPKRSV